MTDEQKATLDRLSEFIRNYIDILDRQKYMVDVSDQVAYMLDIDKNRVIEYLNQSLFSLSD